MAVFFKTNASTPEKPVKKITLASAVVIMILLFAGGLLIADYNETASEVLFRAFEVLFTATIALFGIESVTHA